MTKSARSLQKRGEGHGKNVDVLHATVQSSFEEMLRVFLKKTSAQLTPQADPNPVLAPWISAALVFCREARILLCVHYAEDDARQLAANVYGKPPLALTVEQAGDTMKEYCNLIAGRVKRVLEDGHAKVGMSLPLTMRGFDRVYFEKVDGVNGYDWEWMIELGDTGSRVLFATAQVHLMDRAAFEQLHLGAGPALDVRAGEVSFLQDLEDSGEESGEGED